MNGNKGKLAQFFSDVFHTEPVYHIVGDTELRFVPPQVFMVFKLRHVKSTIGRELRTLFAKSDMSRTITTRRDGKNDWTEEVFDAKSAEVLEFEEKRKDLAVQKIVDCLLEESNQYLLAELILNCLRQDPHFKDLDASNPEVQKEFVHQVDAIKAAELFTGVLKALGDGVRPLVERVKEEVMTRLRPTEGNPETTEPPSQTT